MVHSPSWFNDQTIVAVSVPFLITFFLLPVVLRVARAKDITARVNSRTSHTGKVPLMGGLAIFTGFYIPALLFLPNMAAQGIKEMIAGSIIVIMLGIKDDIIGITPIKKLAGQTIAALILIFLGDVRFTDLHGFLGFNEIGYGWSIFITFITIVGITNCYNLIDGVDGLAAGLGSLSLLNLAVWFYLTGNETLMLACLMLFASLIAFIPFNLRNHDRKIFLGDTGSMTLGFILSFMIIRFNQTNIGITAPYDLISAPAVSIAIAFVPVFDTLRVTLLRLLKQKSPFHADKTHLHHKLLALGLNHGQTSLILILLNEAFILFAFLSQYIGTTLLLITLLISGALVFLLPNAILRSRKEDTGSSLINNN